MLITSYLPLSGGTLSGVLHLLGSQYADTANTGSLNLNNSDIYGLNSIKFSDLSDSAAEGLQWYRDATHVDSFWVSGGVMYFTPNRTWGGSATNNIVLHSGNISSYAITSHQSLANYVTLNTAQTISAKKTFSNGLAITGGATENTSMPYFLGIKAFADGGDVQWLAANKVCAAIGAATTSALGNYLPLTGGTLTGGLTLTDINTTGSQGLLAYRPTTWSGVSNTQWGLGTLDSQGVIRSSNSSLVHCRNSGGSATIWDSGNDGSGSSLDADLLDGYHNGEVTAKKLTCIETTTVGVTVATAKANMLNAIKGYAFGNVANVGASLIGNWSNDSYTTVGSSAYSVINVTPQYDGNVYGQFLLFHYASYNPKLIGRNNGAWTAMRTFAFLDDNVASATQLQTSRTIWGQSFNGTANIPITTSGQMQVCYFTGIDGSTKVGYVGRGSSSSDNIYLVAYTSALCLGAVSGTSDIYINTSHNVGIGTTSPAYKLDVNGDIRATGWLRTSGNTGWYSQTHGGGWYMTEATWVRTYNGKSIYAGSGTIRTDGQIQVGDSGSKFLVTAAGAVTADGDIKTKNGELLVQDSLMTYFKVTTAGDVTAYGGITAGGNINCSSLYATSSVRFKQTSGNSHYISVSGTSRNLQIQQTTNGSFVETRFYFTWAGVFWAKTGIYSDGYVSARGQNTSDIRLKSDIRDFNATDIIKALHPVAFKWNERAKSDFPIFRTDDVQYGLIAQETVNVAPWLVDRNMFGDGLWGVKYDKLIPVLAQCQKEQVFRIDDLLVRVRRLESENKELKRKIEILERR